MKKSTILSVIMTGYMSVSFLSGQDKIIVHPEDMVKKPVSEHLLAGFMELGFGRSDLPWGEMLFNRDFELTKPLGMSNPWIAYSRPKKEQEDWWHSGYEEDASKWYSSRDGKREDAMAKHRVHSGYWPAAHGKYHVVLDNVKEQSPLIMAQDRMYLRKGMDYKLTGLFNNGVFMSADEKAEPGKEVVVKVQFFEEGDLSKPLVTKELKVDTNPLKPYEVTLNAGDYEGWATFAIEVPAGKKLGMDLLSLHAGDDVNGWRKDAVEILRDQVKPKTLRFPGGCFASLYDWTHGVGNQEDRPVSYDTFWNCELVNDIGTIEYIDFCRAIETEPFICVPVMFRDQYHAADWVDFCNNPDNEKRIAYGRKEPLNVKYWELDNEQYRRFDAITYAKRCVEFAKAMKAKDPTIKLVMGNYWIFNQKFAEMLEIAGPYIDVVTNRGGSLEEMRKDLKILEEYNKKHNRDITLCHTEFRAPLAKAESANIDGLNRVENNSKETLLNRSCRWEFAMSVLDQYVEYQNMGGAFFTAQFTNLTDGWGENLLNNAKEVAFPSAAGVGMSLMQNMEIAYPQKLDHTDKSKLVVPQIAWNKDRDTLSIVLMNFDNKARTYEVDLSKLGKNFDEDMVVYEINPGDPWAVNTPKEPSKVKVETSKGKIEELKKLTLKPNAVYAVKVKVK